MYRFMSKHSSDQYLLFCHDPLSRLAIDASPCMKLSMNHCVKYITINRMCRNITILYIRTSLAIKFVPNLGTILPPQNSVREEVDNLISVSFSVI